MTRDELFDRAVRVDGGCLELVGVWQSYGYPMVWWQGRHWRASRLVWTWLRGTIPSGLMVCHTCDNRLCIELDHLFLGTASDNVRDAVSKGRWKQPRRGGMLGRMNGMAKLSDNDVRHIRSSQESSWVLARELSVAPITIRNVRRRRTWRHVSDGTPESLGSQL